MRNMVRNNLALALGVALLATGAARAADETKPKTKPADTTVQSPPSETPTAGLDSVLAQWLIMQNEGEVKLAEFAHQRATNADVKEFAEKMMEEHRQMISKLRASSGAANRAAPGGKARDGKSDRDADEATDKEAAAPKDPAAAKDAEKSAEKNKEPSAADAEVKDQAADANEPDKKDAGEDKARFREERLRARDEKRTEKQLLIEAARSNRATTGAWRDIVSLKRDLSARCLQTTMRELGALWCFGG